MSVRDKVLVVFFVVLIGVSFTTVVDARAGRNIHNYDTEDTRPLSGKTVSFKKLDGTSIRVFVDRVTSVDIQEPGIFNDGRVIFNYDGGWNYAWIEGGEVTPETFQRAKELTRSIKMTIQDKVLEAAKHYLNKSEKTDRKLLSELTGIDVFTTPWCAGFVNAILEQVGIEGTNSNLARSFLKFGIETNDPQPGDIVVFKRGNSSWEGHVGFFIRDNGRSIQVLGGNQMDKVCYAEYPRNRVLGFRTYDI